MMPIRMFNMYICIYIYIHGVYSCVCVYIHISICRWVTVVFRRF